MNNTVRSYLKLLQNPAAFELKNLTIKLKRPYYKVSETDAVLLTIVLKSEKTKAM